MVIAPITSNVDRLYSFETSMVIQGKQSKSMVDQVRSVDRKRLAALLGTASAAEMKSLESALRVVFDLAGRYYPNNPGIIFPPFAFRTGRPIGDWRSWAGSIPIMV